MRCSTPTALLALLALVAPLTARPHDGGPHFPPFFDAPPLSGTFPTPVDLCFADDGSLLVACKDGRVYFHDGSVKQSATVLDLRDEVNNNGDRGLLGLALHPGFAPDGGATAWMYLLYCVSPVPGLDWGYADDDKVSFCRLTRYAVDTVGGSVLAELSSREVLLGQQLPNGFVPNALASVHNSHSVGSLRFGSDGSLLLSIGDAAHWNFLDFGGQDPAAFETFTHPETGLLGPHPIEYDSGAFRSQDVRALAGKLLRVDPATGLGLASNPFFDGDPDSAASRVWALGLRNPYRVAHVPGTGALDPALGDPGRFLIAEVGNTDFEELLWCAGGENYQWPCFEGSSAFDEFQQHSHGANPLGFPDCQNPGPGLQTPALLSYHHIFSQQTTPTGLHVDFDGTPLTNVIGRAVIGGAFYAGGDYPSLWDGRYFFADYSDRWIETALFDASGNLLEVRRFGEEVGAITDLEPHPLTGDIHFLDNSEAAVGTIRRIGFGFDKPPVAKILATPIAGFPPLFVQFDGTQSDEPEGQPLSYDWDFGDGSAPSSSPTPAHTYTQNGTYTVTLQVSDTSQQTSLTTLDITVGNTPPTVGIVGPIAGSTFEDGDTLTLTGFGSDIQDPSVSLVWQVDLYHDDHVHPQSANLLGPTVQFTPEPHGEGGELVYYRIQISATDSGGLTGTQHVYVYPAEAVRDLTGTAPPIAHVDELVPPGPQGTGNPDLEVLRDAQYPPPTTGSTSGQYDTFHGGDQGGFDWLGLELPATPGVEFRFVRLEFQEGKHFPGGGWWDSFEVEVRQADQWVPASGLRVSPAYPFEFAANPGFDGASFDSYRLDFDPIAGDAIRLVGDPGGLASFVSAAELRAFGIDLPPAPPTARNIAAEGQVVAKVYELDPSGPQGAGNPSRDLLSNGTLPPVGSASFWASFDSFHNGDQGNDDWLGYEWAQARTFERVVYQEGRHTAQGGWFDSAGLEVLQTDGVSWAPIAGVSLDAPFPGDTSLAGSYETFVFDFPPVVGLGLRVRGAPGGPSNYVSVGELEVYEPWLPESCGWQSFGAGLGGANELSLSSSTPAALGYPVLLEVEGSLPAVPGFLGFALSETQLPLLNGTLLLDPLSLVLLPLAYDAAGRAELVVNLPASPALQSGSLPLQAFALAPDLPGSVRFSNGLRAVGCGP